MSKYIGPALPAEFASNLAATAVGAHAYSDSDDRDEEDLASSHAGTGYLSQAHKSRVTKSQDVDDDYMYGPVLPPGFETTDEKHGSNDVIQNQTQVSHHKSHDDDVHIGEHISSHTSEGNNSSDDDIIGPLPSMAAPSNIKYDAAEEFSERQRILEAEKKRQQTECVAKSQGREEWMMSLPSSNLAADIGLTARSFRKTAAPTQDQSWTKAPKDLAEQMDEAVSSRKRSHVEDSRSQEKDKIISDKLSTYNKEHRQSSLMDLHQKKLKKDKKKHKSDKAERVPFDRDRDMQVNKFDSAQRKAILKKAALLDTRFGHGNQKYE